MTNVSYVPGVKNVSDGIEIGLTVNQAKRLLSLLSDKDDHLANEIRAAMNYTIKKYSL